MPPLVDTEFSSIIGGHNGIAPSVVAQDFFDAFKSDTYGIHIGKTRDIYKLFLKEPAEALKVMQPEP
jgi:uncharacterized oxidoreductase